MTLRKKHFLINAVFVISITAILITSLVLTGRVVVSREMRDRLKTAVDDKAKEIVSLNGDFSSMNFYTDGVSIAVFTPDGTFVAGNVMHGKREPAPFDDKAPPSNGEQSQPTAKPVGDEPPQNEPNGIRHEMFSGDDLLFYECSVTLTDGTVYVVKGEIEVVGGPTDTLLIIACAVTGLLALIGLVFSYYSLKKATQPIRDMAVELDSVENSSDLSRRLEIESNDPDIKNLSKAYNRMLERVERIVKDQERFTSDVSHELRSPLTVLLAESEFALNDLESAEDKNKSLETIYTQTKRLTVMVRQLLDFSRVAGMENVTLANVDISTLTQEIADSVLPENGVTVETDIKSGVVVNTNETLFIRLVTNLIDNAVKYNKEGGNVKVRVFDTDTAAVLEVSDNGIGMDEETLKHIYERMYQADKSRTVGNGLGLGLSFVKEISRILDCLVEVQSKLGEGSTFTVRFKKNV